MDFNPIEDPDEVPESLQERLDEYNRNFEALGGLLGEASLLESSAKKELRVEETKNILSDALPIAVRTMVYLAASADSESVKFKAAQFLIAVSLGKDPAIKAEDPARELIEKLQTPLSSSDFSDHED